MPDKFFLILYRSLALIAIPGLCLLSVFSSKLRRGFIGRRGLIGRIQKRGLKSPIWFHVSSAGEFEQCLAVLEAIKRRLPSCPIFVSYFSPSAQTAIERERRARGGQVPWDADDYAPLDLYFSVRRFLTALRPCTLVIINRELWPEMIRLTHKRQIPTALIASYFHKNIAWIHTHTLRQFDWIGTVDERSRARVQSKGAPNVWVRGDPRIERISRRRKNSAAPWREFFRGRTMVFGSIWPADFSAIKTPLHELAKRGWRLVFVPHEPNPQFVRRLLLFGKGLGACHLWSQFLHKPDERSHLVVDRVGLLADLYGIASVAFVGNSFKGRVHNVAEPAVYRIPVITGPGIINSAEAVELNRLGALSIVRSGHELVATIDAALTRHGATSQAIDRFFESHEGIAEGYAERIESGIKKKAPLP